MILNICLKGGNFTVEYVPILFFPSKYFFQIYSHFFQTLTLISDQTTKNHYKIIAPIDQASSILEYRSDFYLDQAGPSDILTIEKGYFHLTKAAKIEK